MASTLDPRIREVFLTNGPVILHHEPDTVRYENANVRIMPKSTTKLRFILLNWCKSIIRELMGHNVHNATLVCKQIIDYIIFNVLHGDVNPTIINTIGCIGIYFVIFPRWRNTDERLIDEIVRLSHRIVNKDKLIQMINEMKTHHHTEINRILGANYKLLGKGSYGVVCNPALSNCTPNGNPVDYPSEEYVSKLLFKRNAYNKTLRNYETVARIMENNTYKAFEHTPRTLPSIPYILQHEMPTANHTTEIHAVRLPNLGISISDLTMNKPQTNLFRHTPFHLLLQQFYKCHRQVARLQEQHYIHGDIRITNVLWNPATGKLHIIDFDMLNDYDHFERAMIRHYGHFSHPPETLLASTSSSSKWANVNLSIIQHTQLFEDMGIPTVSQELIDYIRMVNHANMTYMNDKGDTNFQIIRNITFPSFDSFGLGMVMAVLFTYAYPKSMNPLITQKELVDILRTRIANGDTAYSEEYLSLIATTILTLALVYRAMINFEVYSRLNAIDSFAQMQFIYDQFVIQHNELMPEHAIAIDTPPIQIGKERQRNIQPNRTAAISNTNARNNNARNTNARNTNARNTNARNNTRNNNARTTRTTRSTKRRKISKK
jgi:serine/threonine protein kinase